MNETQSHKFSHRYQILFTRRTILASITAISTLSTISFADDDECYFWKLTNEHINKLIQYIENERDDDSIIDLLRDMKSRNSNKYYIYSDEREGGFWDNGVGTERFSREYLIGILFLEDDIDQSEAHDVEDYFVERRERVGCKSIPFEINEIFEVEIVDAPASIGVGEGLTLTIDVTNTGDLTATQSIEVDAGPLGSEEITVSLDWGESTTEEVSIPITEADGGEYTVSVSSDDDTASKSVSVVAPTSTPSLDQTSTPAPDQTPTPTPSETSTPAESGSVSTPSTDTMLDTLRTQTLLWIFTIITGIFGGTAAVYFLQNDDTER